MNFEYFCSYIKIYQTCYISELKLEELKKSKPEAVKEIQKLTNELVKKKEESTKLRYESFVNRVKCPILSSLKQERKVCSKCQEQDKKKYKSLVENSLQHAFLVSKEGNPEIYLLTKEDVC